MTESTIMSDKEKTEEELKERILVLENRIREMQQINENLKADIFNTSMSGMQASKGCDEEIA